MADSDIVCNKSNATRLSEEDGRRDLAEITKAIAKLRKRIQLTPEDPAKMSRRFNKLGTLLYSRFEQTGDFVDLDEAIEREEKSVELTPDCHSEMPVRLNSLATFLCSRVHSTENISDIYEAVSMMQRSVALTPDGHADMPERLQSLGTSLWLRFKRIGHIEDLNDAIFKGRESLELTPEGVDMPRRLDSLATSLSSRFERAGDIGDVTEAISLKRKSVERTPDNHERMPARLSSLGSSLHLRFERTGDIGDLDEALVMKRQSVELTPDGHADLPTMLMSLCASLKLHSERTGDIAELNDAVLLNRKSVELTPEWHVDMPGRLTNLAVLFDSRFERTGDIGDLNEGVSKKRRALELTHHGHSMRPARLNSLGISLWMRSERNGYIADLDEAISIKRNALELTPFDHVDMPVLLTSLSRSLESRFQRTDNLRDLYEAIYKYKAAATHPSGSPHTKLEAAKCWVRSLTRNLSHPTPSDILLAFDTTIHLIALTATLEQTLQRRYAHLRDSSGLPLQGASSAFTLGRIDKALEWLEQGRCLVWGQLTNLRTPLDDLRRHDSSLAQNFMETSKQLETAGSVRSTARMDMLPSEKISLEEEAQRHLQLARQWEGLLERVRAIPGFRNFLKPLPFEAILQDLPESGYVIVINVDSLRCDAIVLQAGEGAPLHVPLSNFTLEMCGQYQKDLRTQLKVYHLRDRGDEAVVLSEKRDGERGIRSATLTKAGARTIVQGILKGLWDRVVEPILRRLNLSKTDRSSSSSAPRIWWCPTGPLSFLPLHAAGVYGGNSSETVLDYAISSYTPTVTALTDRVKNGQPNEATQTSSIFVTSQPNAPGVSSIPGTTKEARIIYDVLTEGGVRVEKLEGSSVSAATCLDIMETFSAVHLACHGSQNAEDPLGSRFLFHDGSMELGAILQRNLKDADLAFLSACQTSTGVQELPDEAVHLAAGMLAAGYRRVVATMWSIGDRHAPDVATDFYQYLLDHSKAGFNSELSAQALHHAINQLRVRLGDSSDRSLLTWIPYVHFGY
ncbi:CHAT domain-containing protein [Ephemerocybe angulata]|uniref:CHAT domain-containing protein n=1 Tax=Ephemerocybe angulata TaxID=980116 RepID=A0A8H6H8G8_9AGAR|nr:CHAT domain-containing protein [Tulosesus angulatus]